MQILFFTDTVIPKELQNPPYNDYTLYVNHKTLLNVSSGIFAFVNTIKQALYSGLVSLLNLNCFFG